MPPFYTSRVSAYFVRPNISQAVVKSSQSRARIGDAQTDIRAPAKMEAVITVTYRSLLVCVLLTFYEPYTILADLQV